MSKGVLTVVIALFGWFLLTNFSFATLYLNQESKPLNIINYIRKWGKDIIKTDLDDATKEEGQFNTQYQISNTLDSVRQNLAVYLQWIAGIGLGASVMLLIYNGIILMTSPLSSDQTATVKKRIRYILIWALAITWFYFVLRIMLSIILQLLNN